MSSSTQPAAGAGARRRRRFTETPRSRVEEEEPTSTVTDVSASSTGSESPSSNSKNSHPVALPISTVADGDQHGGAADGVVAAGSFVFNTPTRSVYRTDSAIIRSYTPTAPRAPFLLSGDPGDPLQPPAATQTSAPAPAPPTATPLALIGNSTPSPAGTSSASSETQVGTSSSSRWGQAPRCLMCRLSAAERVMTCCEALLCAGCAATTSCGCPRRLDGFGGPVPLLPRYVIPDEHMVEFPVLLPRARWQLFHTQRSAGGSIFYSYFSMEDAFHRRQAGVLYQIHEYVAVGRRWSQFFCRLVEVQGQGLLLRFAIPPMTPMDVEFLLEVLDRYRQLHDE